MSADSDERGSGPDAEARVPVLADVAQLAGVSQQTVSRVVRGSPSVARRTRERVEAAIAEIGYRPNVAARTLVTKRSHRIGVVAANAALYGAAMTLQGIQEAARATGYSVSLVMLPELTTTSVQEALEDLRAQFVDGAIAVVPEDEAQDAVRAVDAAFPCVLAPGLDGAGVADAYWAEVAAAAPRPTTCSTSATAPSTTSEARPTGPSPAPVPPAGGRPSWNGCASCPARARRLDGRLRTRGRPRPAAAGGHGPLRRQRRHGRRRPERVGGQGLRVPDDVSVVGFDDVPEAAYFAPPLTTVHQDFAEIGRRCVRVLLGRLRDRVVEPGSVSPELVVRSSTAPPPVLR